MERIKASISKRQLDCSPRELEKEILESYNKKDGKRLKELFEVYKNFEIYCPVQKRSEEERINLAKANLDFICAAADNTLRKNKAETTTYELIETAFSTFDVVGPIRAFYREVVNYHPQNAN